MKKNVKANKITNCKKLKNQTLKLTLNKMARSEKKQFQDVATKPTTVSAQDICIIVEGVFFIVLKNLVFQITFSQLPNPTKPYSTI